MRDYTKMIGQTFGHLTVIGQVRVLNRRGVFLQCRCSCGVEKPFAPYALEIGKAKSCGCRAHGKGINNHGWTGYKGISGTVWHCIKKHARHRRIPVSITIQDAWEQWEKQLGVCALSGQQLILRVGSSSTYNGNASLDRIDSSKGYEVGNIQWVHKDINFMKLTHSSERFIDLCKMVAKYNG